MLKKPKQPKPLMNRRIEESDIVPYCPKCGSSFYAKYLFFKTKKCVQPKWDNYYLKG